MYDIESFGGAIPLDGSILIVKMRCGTNERTIVNSTEMLLNMAHNKAVFDAEIFKK